MIKQQRVDLAARPTAGGGEGAPRSAALASPSDHLNRAIIGLLQEDGRLPFKTIAERLDVSEGTVRNRVGWMKRAGMLRIVAVADPAALDYRADAMLGVTVAPGATPARVAERLAVHGEVVYILWVAGALRPACRDRLRIRRRIPELPGEPLFRPDRHRAARGHDRARHVQEPVPAQAGGSLSTARPATGHR